MAGGPAVRAFGFVGVSGASGMLEVRNVVTPRGLVAVVPAREAGLAQGARDTSARFFLFAQPASQREKLVRIYRSSPVFAYGYVLEKELPVAREKGWQLGAELGYVATVSFGGSRALAITSHGKNGAALGLLRQSHGAINVSSIFPGLVDLLDTVVDDTVTVPDVGYMVVPHAITPDLATIWVGTIADARDEPASTGLYLSYRAVGTNAEIRVPLGAWSRDGEGEGLRIFYQRVALAHLMPDTLYEVHCSPALGTAADRASQFMTLPRSLVPHLMQSHRVLQIELE